MSKLLGQMDGQLVEVYRQALMADIPSSVPMAEGLRGISDIKNVLSVIDATRRTIGATGTAPAETTETPGKDGEKKTDTTTTGGDGTQRSMESDASIEEIQRQLLEWDPESLPKYGVDGIWGSETQAAWDRYAAATGGVYRHGAGETYTVQYGDKPPSLGGEITYLDERGQEVSLDPNIVQSEDFRPLYGEYSLTGFDPSAQFPNLFDASGNYNPSGASAWGAVNAPQYNESLRNSPLARIDIQQAPMTNVGTSLSQIKASNKVVAERVKATNGSLTSMHFNSIKDWHKKALLIVENENDSQTVKQAIGIQNSLSALNERAKRLRSDYADIVLNDEISNYAYSYFNFFISEYLGSTVKRMLAKNPNSGEYEYVFISQREGRPILMEEAEKNLRALTKDVASQASILQHINSLTKIAQNVAKKQPGPQEFKSIALDIVKKGRLTSLIYDDILNNASSFFEDVKEHPSFLKPDVAAFPELPRDPGEFNWYDNISEVDYIEIYNIITDPGHAMFNYKSNPRSPLGITEVLLVDYIAGYFESHYNKARGTADKKPTEMIEQGSPVQKKQPMTKRDILKKYNL